MPAGSDQGATGGQLSLPRTWRPLGPRIAGVVAIVVLVFIVALLWIGFDQETRDAVTPFQRGTVVAMFGGGVACLYALVRSRVQARTEGIVVVNGYRQHEYDWAQVVAVRLDAGAPWVSLDLADGTTVPAMGIQGSDGARAKQAVRELRVLLDRAHPPGD